MTAKLPAGPCVVPPRSRGGRRASPQRDYFDLPGVHWSTLKAMSESPLHYRFAATHKVEPTPAMLIGQAVHQAVLEPDDFPRHWAVYGGTRRGAAWDTFAVANNDKNILTEDDYAKVLAMRDSVRSHPVARKLLVSGRAEVPLFWTDAKTGLRCKARLDWLRPRARVLVELKSARQFDEHSWVNTIARSQYHGQLAMYLNGLAAVYGMEADAYLIGVENVEPFDAGVFRLSDDWLYAGELLVRDLLDRVAALDGRRRALGRYPAVRELELPRWVEVRDGGGDES